MRVLVSIFVTLMTINAFGYDRVITCQLEEHDLYSQAVLYGDSEIHFIRKDGTDDHQHHDGFLIVENNDIILAYYHDGDDLLFYLSKTFKYGNVVVPGDGLHSMYDCKIETN